MDMTAPSINIHVGRAFVNDGQIYMCAYGTANSLNRTCLKVVNLTTGIVARTYDEKYQDIDTVCMPVVRPLNWAALAFPDVWNPVTSDYPQGGQCFNYRTSHTSQERIPCIRINEGNIKTIISLVSGRQFRRAYTDDDDRYLFPSTWSDVPHALVETISYLELMRTIQEYQVVIA